MAMLRLLDVDGTLVGDAPMGLDEARELLSKMLECRAYDRRCTALQKQGRLATYASFEGQEAAQVGAMSALRGDDWLVATYRDAAAMWVAGYPWLNLLLGRMGDERGGSPPEGVRVLPPSITVGAHMIHAVGLGWAERIKGTDAVALTSFGDGATSEGDFHEAMNFAGVFATPTVFLCQNNGWAISMARERQTSSDSIAAKAVAYGMPGMQVDGNDVFAVHLATQQAVARARAGEGATLIEAVTYRIGPHTTADDPSRYRDDAEVTAWRARDPLERLRAYLRANDSWDEAWEAQAVEAGVEAVDQAVTEAEALEPMASEEVFAGMFAEPTGPLLRQLGDLQRDLGEG